MSALRAASVAAAILLVIPRGGSTAGIQGGAMSDELFSLVGRVALVTGGIGGLGLAMAMGLSRAGAKVAVTGRNEIKNDEARRVLGVSNVVVRADVTEEQSVI